MEELTEKQLKTRWIDIKKQINERQLLAYRVGIPLEKWDTYMYSLPSADEINRIYSAIQEDRKVQISRNYPFLQAVERFAKFSAL